MHAFEWDDQLDLAYTSFVASTQRGIGPGKQSCPLPFHRFGDFDLNALLVTDGFPVVPGFCSVLFTFFLLRELECATAEFADMTLDHHARTVKTNLSVSKTDPRALGCERSWGCTCPDDASPQPRSCPYHAASALETFLVELFADAVLEEGFPLFPNRHGGPVTPSLMIELINEIARIMGEPLRNKAGQNRFGKHSWRATGAVHLGECGIEVQKIMLIGRWRCTIVLLYTRCAPISDIAGDYKRARINKEAPKQLMNITSTVKKIQSMVDKASAGMSREVAILNDRLNIVERTAIPVYVVNRRTRRWHKILSKHADAGVEALAFCGFKYAAPSARCRFETTIPDDIGPEDICTTCLG